MNLKQLTEALRKTKMPVAHYAFKKPTPPPCIVYLTPVRTPFSADGKAAAWAQEIQVVLFTREKDQAAEKEVQEVLDDLRAVYTVTEEAIDTESLYSVTFDFEIIITEV